MRHRLSLAALVTFSLLWVIDGRAQVAGSGAVETPPRLKPSPVLEPPAAAVAKPAPATDRDAIFLRADRLEGEGQKWIEAEGKVELRTRRQTVLADWLRYDTATDEIWGKGNVTLRRGIDWVTGPEVKFKRSDESGYFDMPEFHIGENASRGDAKQIIFQGPDHDQLKEVRYTTCVAPNEDWYLQANDVDLDKSRQVGVAHDTTVYFKGTPILYSPYLTFPLSNERKSGFLTPVLGSSNQRGFEASLPYYLNLAPNYDATILARSMSRRGIQTAGQFRYLFPQANGEADAEYLPHDRVTDTDRYALALRHNEDFGGGFSGFINAQKVSDDTYFADLSDRLALTSQTNLPRFAGVAYNHDPFSLLAQVQKFQTLQDPNNPITPPYFREPQLAFTMRPVEWEGLDFAAIGEYVNFQNSALTPTGTRSFIYPTVSWSKNGSWWFFTAQTGVHATYYDLENPATPPASFDRVLPITTLDGGIVFERDAEWFGRKFIQTLEPRAFYVNIPFHNQSNYPIFDTAQDDFNYSHLFTANRYLGWDRIGDANQMTLAVQSRFLDPESGAERMRFGIGQQYYFESQQVTLNEPPRTTNSSDILVFGESRLSEVWTAAGLLVYQPTPRQTQELDLGGRYQPAAGQVLNVLYRYIFQYVNSSGQVSQLKQIDASGQWPLSNNWSVIGRWNYSLVDAKTLEGVIGFEYNGGCWVFRIAAQRLQTNTQQVSNSVFVQLELNGLARLGTNPVDVFTRNVAGYTTSNDPTRRPSGEPAGAADFFPRF
jgi:LPS-assembly protein